MNRTEFAAVLNGCQCIPLFVIVCEFLWRPSLLKFDDCRRHAHRAAVPHRYKNAVYALLHLIIQKNLDFMLLEPVKTIIAQDMCPCNMETGKTEHAPASKIGCARRVMVEKIRIHGILIQSLC